MHPFLRMVSVAVCLLASTSAALGQTMPAVEESSDPATRGAELQTWVREYTRWAEWATEWGGRLEPGWFGPRDRRTKPDPPSWLFDECPLITDPADPLAGACRLLADWQDDFATRLVKAKILADRTRQEAPENTKWWSHVHFDALWLTPNVPASYGVIGVHTTIKVAGRWQVFLAPGAILLNVPAARGTREWKPATDIGLSYRLFDLELPGSRQGTVHLSVVKAWLMKGSGDSFGSSVDLVGLSLSLK